MRRSARALTLLLLSIASFSCRTASKTQAGEKLARRGDEIVIAGQYFHTGAPVVLWTDPGGFDAYRTERRFSDFKDSSHAATTRQADEIYARTGKVANFYETAISPQRLRLRSAVLDNAQIEKYRGGGWDLATLADKVDQFVYHFDVTGTSSQCFFILHDIRGLSVHFMLDVDGTIYQTCDAKERAAQATIANERSVGIEIANIGAYRPDSDTLKTWYRKDANGRTQVVLPKFVVKTPLKAGPGPYYPSRNEPVQGNIQGKDLEQYDLTPQQYDSLIKLTATLATVLPKITVDYPRDKDGKLIPKALDGDAYMNQQGMIGHYHVQTNKTDPGPAFDWERVKSGAWAAMTPAARAANNAARGKPTHFVNPPTTWPSHWGLRAPWGATTQPAAAK